jgi:hypothetical protein
MIPREVILGEVCNEKGNIPANNYPLDQWPRADGGYCA